jgi:hypothetical protein
MDKKDETNEPKRSYWALNILMIFALLGVVELFNHTRAGPYRAWLITDDELARLMARELTIQSVEQEMAKGEELDNKMAAIARQQDRDSTRKLK